MGDFVTNLIGHWRLNDNSGSTTIAASVNNNGTLSGAGNTVDSTFSGPTNYLNKSLFFDGINDGITLTSAGTLSLAQNRSAITLATWVKTSYTGTQQIAMWWSSNSANVARAALSIGSVGEFRGISRCTDGDVTQSISGGFIADGNWHHIASVFNYPNDSITLYIDGQTIDQSGSVSFVGTATSNTSSSNARIGFGSSSSNPGFLLSGYLADARFYNRALTSEDIYSLYQYSESGLIGHWKLDDNNSTTTVMPIVGPTGLLSGAGNTSGSYVLGPGGSLTGAMLFDGVNDIVRLSISQPFLNRVSGSTVSYWARTTFFPSVNTPVTFVNNNGLPGNSRLAIYCAASTGRLIAAGRAADGELAQTSSGILNYNDGNWHHFAEVVDLANDSISLYVDGVYAPQNSVANFGNVITSSTNPTRVTIGGIDNANINWFRGHVADVRYYENILSSGNIYDLYSLANIEYPPLSGHWQLFDNEDSSVIRAQVGDTGTISGGIYSSLITTSPPGNQITGALYFNSTGINLLNPINSRLLSNQNTISTSCWFKTTGNGQTEYQRIINIYTSAFNTVRLTVALNPEGKIQVLARSSDGESFQIKKTVQSGYNDNNWHHLVTTLDYYNDSINIYVDNSESSSTGTINFSLNNVQNSSSTGFQIGGQDGGYFIGSMADVRIYRGLLSSSAIESLYLMGSEAGETPSNLFSDWFFYAESIPRNPTGTLTGCPLIIDLSRISGLFEYAKPDGGDIRASIAGTGELPIHIVHYNTGTRKGLAIVNVDKVPENQRIRLHWLNPTGTMAPATGTYGQYNVYNSNTFAFCGSGGLDYTRNQNSFTSTNIDRPIPTGSFISGFSGAFFGASGLVFGTGWYGPYPNGSGQPRPGLINTTGISLSKGTFTSFYYPVALADYSVGYIAHSLSQSNPTGESKILLADTVINETTPGNTEIIVADEINPPVTASHSGWSYNQWQHVGGHWDMSGGFVGIAKGTGTTSTTTDSFTPTNNDENLYIGSGFIGALAFTAFHNENLPLEWSLYRAMQADQSGFWGEWDTNPEILYTNSLTSTSNNLRAVRNPLGLTVVGVKTAAIFGASVNTPSYLDDPTLNITGLVGHWPLQDTGNTSVVIGNVGPNGTATGEFDPKLCSQFTIDGPGSYYTRAFRLNYEIADAEGRYVAIPTSTLGMSYTGATIFGRVRTTPTGIDGRILSISTLIDISGSIFERLYLGIEPDGPLSNSGQIVLGTRTPDNVAYSTTGGVYNFSDWRTVAGTINYQNGEFKIYLDGNEVWSTGLSPSGQLESTQPDYIRIGTDAVNIYQESYIDLADVRLYNKVLSSTDINRIHRLSSDEYVISGLVAQWPMQDDESDHVLLAYSGGNGYTTGIRRDVLDATYSYYSGSARYTTDASVDGPGGMWSKGIRYGINTGFDQYGEYAHVPTGYSIYRNISGATIMSWVRIPSGTQGIPAIVEILGTDVDYWRALLRVDDTANSSPPFTNRPSGFFDWQTNTRDTGSIFDPTITTHLTTLPLYLDSWNHICATVDFASGTSYLYLNGTQVTGETGIAFNNPTNPNSEPVTITLGATRNYDPFDELDSISSLHGDLADVRIYHRPLNGTDISRIYQLGVTDTGTPFDGTMYTSIYVNTSTNFITALNRPLSLVSEIKTAASSYAAIDKLINTISRINTEQSIIGNIQKDIQTYSNTYTQGNITPNLNKSIQALSNVYTQGSVSTILNRPVYTISNTSTTQSVQSLLLKHLQTLINVYTASSATAEVESDVLTYLETVVGISTSSLSIPSVLKDIQTQVLTKTDGYGAVVKDIRLLTESITQTSQIAAITLSIPLYCVNQIKTALGAEAVVERPDTGENGNSTCITVYITLNRDFTLIAL